jgi:hypothetical protein
VKETRAWRSFNAEAGASVLEKILFTDADKDGGFQPSFDQIKKENFYVGLDHYETRDRRWTGTAVENSKILRGSFHISKQFMFLEKKILIWLCLEINFAMFIWTWFLPSFLSFFSLFNEVKLYGVESFSD